MEQALRLTGAQLRGFEVVPLPVETYRGRDNPFLQMQWSKRNPNHWVPGVRRGEAKALYHLAIIHERQKRDVEAHELHLKTAAVSDPAQKEWAEKSRWRLENIPWLKAQSGKDGKRESEKVGK